MNDYPQFPLLEVADVIMGQSPPSTTYNLKGEGLPFYQGKIDFGEINPTARTYCTSPQKIAKEFDILISVRAPIGAMNVAIEECCIGRGLAAIRAKSHVFCKYLYYALSSCVDELVSQGTGSTFKAIGKDILSSITIPLPPLEEQKKIAATLDTVSDLIRLRKRQLEELDLLVKAKFTEMFSSEKTICKLSDVCALINGDRGKNYPSDSDFVCEGVPFINAGHLSKNRVDFSNMNYITEDKYSQLSQGKIRKYDVLYCLRGSLGKHAIIDFEKGAIASSLVIIRAKQNMILPQYLMMVLGIDEVIRQQNVFNNGSSQPNLSAASVKSYIIPLPAISRQRDFVQFIEFISEFESNINQGLEELYMLKNSLMQQHFR